MDCMVCKGINCPWNPPSPMGSPGNSRNQSGHVHEVPLSGPVGGNVDRIESITGPGAKETVGASGTDAFTGAKGFAYRSFGADAKSTPAHGPGNHKFSDGINGGHQKGTPALETGFSPLMGVACPSGRNARDRERKAKGNPSRVPVGSEANTSPGENLETTQGRVSARFPRFPNPLGGLARIYVA
jgi:hypothetical protein